MAVRISPLIVRRRISQSIRCLYMGHGWTDYCVRGLKFFLYSSSVSTKNKKRMLSASIKYMTTHTDSSPFSGDLSLSSIVPPGITHHLSKTLLPPDDTTIPTTNERRRSKGADV